MNARLTDVRLALSFFWPRGRPFAALALAELRRRIVEEAHLPYVYVPLDPDDRLENDGHPDADGAREIAESIADALADTLLVNAGHSTEEIGGADRDRAVLPPLTIL